MLLTTVPAKKKKNPMESIKRAINYVNLTTEIIILTSAESTYASEEYSIQTGKKVWR